MRSQRCQEMKIILCLLLFFGSTSAFTCPSVQTTPLKGPVFANPDNLSYEKCGVVTDSSTKNTLFPWDAIVFFKQDFCSAPAVIISQRALLFDSYICDVEFEKDDIEIILRDDRRFQASKMFISKNTTIGLMLLRAPLPVEVTPVCLYNLGSEDQNQATFLASTSANAGANEDDAAMVLSSECQSLASTSTDCEIIDSKLCFKKARQRLLRGFVLRKVGARYFLRAKLQNVPFLKHNDHRLQAAVDILPLFGWISKNTPDVKALTTIPTILQGNFQNLENCGRSTSTRSRRGLERGEVHGLVTGGSSVMEPGTHPWQALIICRYYDIAQAQSVVLRCGGTLISPKAVLTAAHCLVFEKTQFDRDEITVVMGAHNRSDTSEKTRQKAHPSKVLVHPDYSSRRNTYENDIALLLFDEPFNFKPICLWNKNSSVENLGLAILAGWGLDKNQSSPEILQEALMNVPTYEECFRLDPVFYQKYLRPGVNFCAGDIENEAIACQGDSGGGLMVQDEEVNRWFIRGVVSFGKTRKLDNNETTCDWSKYPLFSDVAYYLPWIVLNVPELQ